MTMLLMSCVSVQLRTSSKKGWFELSGEVREDEAVNVEDWIADNLEDGMYERVDGAKIVGIHDDVDLEIDDPRFNGERDDSAIVVRDTREDTYFLFLDVNVPEAALLRHAQALREATN
ncbi:hypothetical protein [Cupriavidus pinatubonensis]|uniref:Lipoprotein n=1 Tax=Cupriavidus pinatubonensis TaxID=248026 RepID=A0ABN7ZLF2_9BURK|nr:hypothetical protein [Cupriavidus pinatubonensis]CAG9185036.1 hypothetical protein LMG23994_05586 [Cupriavidus pinatubonensis]